MALKACHECGKDVSTQAEHCPHCGAKVKKGTSILGWIGIAILALIVVNIGQHVLRTTGITEPSRYDKERQVAAQALASTKLANFSWQKAGFGNVMMADFVIHNGGSQPVKDVEITCTSYGKSGTKIDTNRKVIYETVPAGKRKRVKEFNMGFQHSQADSASCEVTDVKPL